MVPPVQTFEATFEKAHDLFNPCSSFILPRGGQGGGIPALKKISIPAFSSLYVLGANPKKGFFLSGGKGRGDDRRRKALLLLLLLLLLLRLIGLNSTPRLPPLLRSLDADAQAIIPRRRCEKFPARHFPPFQKKLECILNAFSFLSKAQNSLHLWETKGAVTFRYPHCDDFLPFYWVSRTVLYQHRIATGDGST